jgi:hypothetical protein
MTLEEVLNKSDRVDKPLDILTNKPVKLEAAPFRAEYDEVRTIDLPALYPDAPKDLDEAGVEQDALLGEFGTALGSPEQFGPLSNKLGLNMDSLAKFGLGGNGSTGYDEKQIRETLRKILRML